MIWSLFSKQNDGLLRHDDTAPGRVAFDGYFSQTGFSSKYMVTYPASRGPSTFLDKSLPLPDLSRKIEGPLLAG